MTTQNMPFIVFYGSLLEEHRNKFIVGNKMLKKTLLLDLFE